MKSLYKNSIQVFRFFLGVLLFSGFHLANSQERICLSYEYELAQRDKYRMGTIDEFESRFATLVSQNKNKRASEEGVFVIPIIVHVIHDGEAVGTGDNISAAFIEAQIEQLNNDFRKVSGTSGDNSNPVGTDTFIEFAPALVDPEGNLLEEPGINRINRNDMGWTAPPYSVPGDPADSYIDLTIKPDSYWDSDRYFNFWVMDLAGGLLGYAQFPSLSELDGLSADGGPAATDGVVILNTSVGSTDFPNSAGAPYGEGRTATHEVGHWLGLRHIWGDGACGADDFCADTPASDDPNFGCPTGHESCESVDMIENYMDYTDDSCMNVFTVDQKARMDAVLAVSPRRASLATSTVHLAPFPNLIISEVVDGTETGDSPKYVELHNASEESYDISGLLLRVFADGASEATYSIEVPSETTLAGGESYVISSVAFDTEWGGDFASETPDLVDPSLIIDGDDAIDLFDAGTGLAVDVFGEVGFDGTGTGWEYTDGIAERESYVLSPSSVFDEANWSFSAYAAGDVSPGSHLAEIPAFDASVVGISGIDDGGVYYACEGSIVLYPSVLIENTGSAAFSSVDIAIDVNGSISGETATFDEIGPGEVAEVTLESLEISVDGSFYFSVAISDESDGNPTNNEPMSVDYEVNIFEDASTLTIDTQTDEYPEETIWYISDSEGNVIYTGSGFEANALASDEVCLEDGDYIFSLHDAYGDGIFEGYSSLYVGEDLVVTIPGDHPDFDATPFGADPETIEIAFSIPYVPYPDVGVVLNSPESGDFEFCSDQISFAATLVNEGSTIINSIELSYGFSGSLESMVISDLFYMPGDEIELDFGLITLVEGSNSLEVTIDAINEGEDVNPSNDVSTTVNYIPSDGNAILLTLSTDDYPEETSWTITDSEDAIVAENGALSANSDVQSVVCLEDGTYTFTVFDSFGDGIENEIAVLLEDSEEQQVAVVGGDFDESSSVTFTLPYVPFTDLSLEIESPADEDEILSCSDEVEVVVFLENTGSAAITSLVLALGEEELEYDDILINVGESGTLSLGRTSLSVGANTITASVVSVNGAEDDDPLNDESSVDVTYTMDESTSSVTVDLHLDDFPGETSWEITDGDGIVVAGGSGYSEEGVTVSEITCLPDGCYTFTLFDFWDDGGPGVDVVVGENVEFSVEAGNWGTSVSGTVCVGDALRPVSDFEAVGTSPFSIDLSWTYEYQEDGFQILRSFTGEEGSYAFLTDLENTATSFTDDNGLTPSTTYYYAIVVKRGEESSAVSYTSTSTSANIGETELFEGFEGGEFPPAGWLSLDEDGDTFNWYLGISPSHDAYEGEQSAVSASYENDTPAALTPDNYLITPALDIDDDYKLIYFVAAQDPDFAAENYEVLVSTTGTDPEDFTDQAFTEVLSTADWGEREVDLSSYSGSTIYIAFRHYDVTDEFEMKIDNVFVGTVSDETGSGVLPPADLTATAVSPYQIDLSWSHDDADQFEIHRSLSDAIGTFEIVEVIDGSALTYSDMGLEPSTTYYYEVRAVKGEDTSVGATASATTEEGNLGEFKLDEGFEGETFPPAGWLNLDEDGDTNFWFEYTNEAVGSEVAFEGVKCVASASWISSGELTPDNYLITPSVTIESGDFLVYNVAAQDPDWTAEKYQVLISTTGTEIEDFSAEVTTETLASADWEERSFDLSEYAGETVYIAFRHFDVTNQFYMKLDAVKVGDPSAGEAPPAAPSDLVASASSYDEITLSWSDNADNEDSFELQGAESAEGPWAEISTSIAENSTSYVDGDLTPETTYFYRLRATNTVGTTAWTSVASATTSSLVLGTNYLGDVSVNMYPNPVNSSLTIMLSAESAVEVTVSDISGRKHAVNVENAGRQIQVDMSHLATGLYFVHLDDGKNELNWRILKK